jgi:anti-sigma factor ChrR (cupin superfamily)
MPRPHIEFVQAQRLPWSDQAAGPMRPGVAAKVLSRDAETGALSAILRYPPGYARPAERLAVDEEFFVLDGALETAEGRFTPDCYAHWPAGFARGAVAAPGGAVVLTFLSGPLADGEEGQFDPTRLVPRLDIREGEWKADLAAMGLQVMAAHAWIRRLRSDPRTGEITYVTAVMPYFRETQAERHPVVQEIFVLAGEVAGNTGVMRAGAYTWRPENVIHGPYGSTAGAVFFFRSHGGPQTTVHEPPMRHSFEVEHRPVLPPDLRDLGAPYPPPPRY